MRKQVLFMSAFLLLCVTGCSNDESEVNDVNNVRGGVIYEGYTQQEIDKSDPLAVFFGNELHGPRWGAYGNELKTFFEQGGWNDETCLAINSRQEFQTAYMGTKELPDVDFDQYTLVIGRTWGNDGSYTLNKIVLRDNGQAYELETQLLHHHYSNMAVTCAIISICYWRLYPKLAQKAIIPKRTVKDVFE